MRKPLALSLFGVVAASSIASACGGDAPPPTAFPAPTVTAPAPSSLTSAPARTVDAPPPAPALEGLSPEEEAALDRSTSPCDDFYQFACGGWQKATNIPDDEATWSRSFSVIHEKNETILRNILEHTPKNATPAQKQLADFYASCMNEEAIEAAGATPLKADLAAIDALRDAKGIAAFVGKEHLKGHSPFFALGSQQDFANATKMIGAIDQSGLGLPDRDYYVKAEGKFPELKKKYEEHVAAMFALIGDKDPKATASRVLIAESGLAQAQMTKEDRRDPKKIYHLTPKEDFAKIAPDFPWASYLGALPLGGAKEFNVAQPQYLLYVGRLVTSAPTEELKAYLKWHVLRAAAPTLSHAFVDEAFRWQQILKGTAKLPPRWKRCVRMTDAALGEALAQPFVMQTLGPEGKANVREMIAAIEEEMKRNLSHLSWMDDKTRGLALEKLAKIANKVAYPDKWRSYAGLQVTRTGYFANVTRANIFEEQRQLRKIGKPVDRNEWFMTPPTVNAYYDPSLNEMVFPAGILQPPFYANTMLQATNYGGIGMVMGHELTHGFDDEGRQFDAAGNLKDWWSPAVNAEFEKRASCVEKQFDGYTVLDTQVNGKLTLGENIADLGGVKLSLLALRSKQQGAAAALPVKAPAASSKATSPEQRFFLGFAQGWCSKYRDETMRLLIATNPHAPPQLRVNGPLSNLPEFAAAFSCKSGHKMVRTNRCEVW
ncbi:MAG: M13 family metallopeptidase [Polyangiaceae bacterium]